MKPLLRELIVVSVVIGIVFGVYLVYNFSSEPDYRDPGDCIAPVEIIHQDLRVIACSESEIPPAIDRLGLDDYCAAQVLRTVSSASYPARVRLDYNCQNLTVEENTLSGSTAVLLGLPINLNSADQADLEALDGIGPELASSIIQDRNTNGPFCSVSELSRIKGIGPAFIVKHKAQLKADCD